MRSARNYLGISAARADALFVSALQRSEQPGAWQVWQAVAVPRQRSGRRAGQPYAAPPA